jgi:putative transposase
MEATANARRFIYNLALEQRRAFWRQFRAATGRSLNLATQGPQITELKAYLPWLAAVHVTPLQQAIRDLDCAFSGFFSGRAKYPGFQSKRRHMGFRHAGREVRLGAQRGRWASVRVPKIGMVRLRLTRPLVGHVISATFAKDALGWHVSFACEIEHYAPANGLPAIGIDRGVANTLALSNGEMMSTPDISALERRKRKAQRILARRQRGSNRYLKQRKRLTRVAAKIARVRADWQHNASTVIARRFGHVALEDLDTANMTRAGKGKRGLNRSILAQGWRGFETKLRYKLETSGGTLIKINPAYTSQTCSACGTIDKAARESQARFACRECGFTGHADTNAAIVILRRSTAVVEGCGCAPDEARTNQALAA